MFANVALLAAANVGHYATATPTSSPTYGFTCGLAVGEISLVALAAKANRSGLVQFLKEGIYKLSEI